MTIEAIPWGLPAQPSGSDRAIGGDAKDLWSKLSSLLRGADDTSVSAGRRNIVAELGSAYLRAVAPNWDGEGAAPIAQSTFEYAQQLVSLLPEGLPTPEVYPERDGDIAFEWDLAPRRVLSISIGRDGTLTYAGLFGRSKAHGVEFLGDTIPPQIWLAFTRLASEDSGE